MEKNEKRDFIMTEELFHVPEETTLVKDTLGGEIWYN